MQRTTDEHTGTRIAKARKLAGYTQRGLAEHAHLSLGCIRKIERGERLPTAGVLTAVARTLRVTVADLTGQPCRRHPQDERVHAPIAGIRAALRQWNLPADWFERPRSPEELHADVRTALRHRSAGRLTSMGLLLPGLLEELTAAVHLHTGARQRYLAGLLSFTLDLTHTLTYRLGYPDLRGQVEDRLRWASALSGDPLLMALAEYARVETFKSAHEYEAGLRLMESARERLTAEAVTRGPEYLTVLGGMRLRDVTMASRAQDEEATAHHLGRARELLRGLPELDDRRHYCLVFGRGNVAIHEIQAQLELRRLADADRMIRDTRMPSTVPPTRMSAWHINVARAHIAAGRRQEALEGLKRARETAPQITRYKPAARDAAVLLNTQFRRTTEDLRALNAWFGLDVSS